MPPLRSGNCSYNSRRTSAYNYNFLFHCGRHQCLFDKTFIMIVRIHRTANISTIRRYVIALQTANAWRDICFMAMHGFIRPIRISDKTTAKSYQINGIFSKQFFSFIRIHNGTDHSYLNFFNTFLNFTCPLYIWHMSSKIRGCHVYISFMINIQTGGDLNTVYVWFSRQYEF